ncbi:MAG: transglutaminase-like domain-containing protein [Balneolaceae bacterium]
MKSNHSTIGEIESLIYLLDDPDPEVQESVKLRFKELGENAVPLLDQFRTESIKIAEKKAINEIIYNITIDSLFVDFSDLISQGIYSLSDLEEALFTLARFGNPTLRTEEYKKRLDKLTSVIGSKITSTPSLSEKMQILLKYLFRELRFRGDATHYHHIDNAYLDRVIDQRKGMPIMLSVVVLLISNRLGLPFYGVNMPIHFMLMYETPNQAILIDPFDGGTIVTYNQCYYFLKKNGIEPRPEHLKKATPHEILIRCIRNMTISYRKINDDKKVADLNQLLRLMNEEVD